MSKILSCTLTLFLTFNCFAKAEHLTTVTNDTDQNLNTQIFVELNQYNELEGLTAKTSERTTYISLGDIRKGASLAEYQGVSIGKIEAPALHSVYGGQVTITFLSNILDHSYQQINLNLIYNGKVWFLAPIELEKSFQIGRIHLILRKIWGQIVGVKKIQLYR